MTQGEMTGVRLALALLLALFGMSLLSGCGADATTGSAPPPPPPPVAPAPAPAVVAPPVAAVVKAYQAARRKELPAVSAPGVSAGYITNIANLEIAAREAVRHLIRQDGRRRPDALGRARAAVRALDDALAARP